MAFALALFGAIAVQKNTRDGMSSDEGPRSERKRDKPTLVAQEAAKAAEVRFPKGRVKFAGATASAPFPVAVIVFRPKL